MEKNTIRLGDLLEGFGLKEEPFEDGWLVKIKPSDPSELESLMTKKEYEEFLESSEEDDKEDDDKKGKEEEDVDEDDFV